MNRTIATALMLFLVLSLAIVLAQDKTATPAAQTSTSGASAAELKQIENDWVEAVKGRNAERLGEILANEWVEVRWDGVTVKKTQALADIKEPGNSLQSVEMGPMNVRFFGNTAIVTGSDTEKSTDNGKDTSGKYVWTDVFVKQSGRWKAVASQSSKVPK